MAIEDFRSIEFGICIEGNEGEEFYRIPIDDSVRESLSDMYDAFYESYDSVEGEAEEFQASEKYASTEKLSMQLNQDSLESIRALYNEDAIQVNAINLSTVASSIVYYFAIFRVGPRTKKIAIKRPSQFKGLLKKKLIHFMDDTLQVIPDDVFKLDYDFDFIITRNNIEILHPMGFIFIANIDEEIQRTAVEATQALSERIAFIDFNSIAPFVETSKTAAKLISSIKSRDDLEQTSQQKLMRTCRALGINVRVRRGLVVPEDADILNFLHVLDRREYVVDVTEQAPEIYIAASRKKVR